MWRSKKVIIAVVVAVVLLVGSIGGVALAQTGSTSQDSGKTLLARVATILGIDQKKVEDAFAQAQREMRDESLNNYLKNLIDQGKITQPQADEYKKWLQSRPDAAPYQQQLKGWQQARPDLPQTLKDWEKARPNIPFAPGPGRPGHSGRMGGFGFPPK